MTEWAPPPDIDPEVIILCQAMNAFPGISTVESCCGHGRRPFRVWFTAERLDYLLSLLYWVDGCHTGEHGWQVIAFTDCAADYVTFRLEGPAGGYRSSEIIAKYMREALEQPAEDEEPGR